MATSRLVQPNEGDTRAPLRAPERFWLLLLVASLVTGVIAALLMTVMHAAQHASYAYSHGLFQQAVRRAGYGRRVAVLALAGLVTAVVVRILQQDVPGHGGDLTETIWFRSGRMSFTKTLMQSLLSVIIVGMGASLGREGAPKQMGAATASVASRLGGLSAAEARLLGACCGGAAMGAVYNVPLGGALFALEVLVGTLALPLLLPALASSFVATWASWVLLPDRPTYMVATHAAPSGTILWSLAFGPLAGLAAAAFVRLIIAAHALKPKRGAFMGAPLVVFALLGLAAGPYPELLGNGKDVAQYAFDGRLALPLLAALVLLKPLATAACLGAGAPGGLFTPSLTFGALLGALGGQIWRLVSPDTSVGACALIGAVTVLSVTMQAPLSAFILFFELTHHVLGLAVPMMASVTGAMLVARRLEPCSIYSGKIAAGRSQARIEPGWVPGELGPWFTDQVSVVSAAADYTEILARLLATPAAAGYLYVVDETGRLRGRIGRDQAVHPGPLPRVLATAAAADLVEPVIGLDERTTAQDMRERLAREPGAEWPVVDSAHGRLHGVVRARP